MTVGVGASETVKHGRLCGKEFQEIQTPAPRHVICGLGDTAELPDNKNNLPQK